MPLRKFDRKRIEVSIDRLRALAYDNDTAYCSGKNLQGVTDQQPPFGTAFTQDQKDALRTYLTTWIIPNLDMVLAEQPEGSYNYDFIM